MIFRANHRAMTAIIAAFLRLVFYFFGLYGLVMGLVNAGKGSFAGALVGLLLAAMIIGWLEYILASATQNDRRHVEMDELGVRIVYPKVLHVKAQETVIPWEDAAYLIVRRIGSREYPDFLAARDGASISLHYLEEPQTMLKLFRERIPEAHIIEENDWHANPRVQVGEKKPDGDGEEG